jgi:hypothetical protein
LRYVLAPRGVVARARALGVSGAAVAVAPAWLVVVLVAQLGLAPSVVTVGVAAAIGALGVARGIVSYVRAKKRLEALSIDADDEGLTLRGEHGETRIPRAAIVRAVEIEGLYGGLRLELDGEPLPPRVEVPRGGDAFFDLRARVASWRPIARAPRRGRAARLGLVAAVVLALFFVPFVVADVRGSRVAVALVLVVSWGALRAALSRA